MSGSSYNLDSRIPSSEFCLISSRARGSVLNLGDLGADDAGGGGTNLGIQGIYFTEIVAIELLPFQKDFFAKQNCNFT